MRKKVTEAQFTEAIYRHYYGESLSSIAKDFGAYPSVLSELKCRRCTDWERIENVRIIDIEIGRFQTAKTDAKTRTYLMRLLKLVMSANESTDILSALCAEHYCTPSEAHAYIQTFEALLPLKITP